MIVVFNKKSAKIKIGNSNFTIVKMISLDNIVRYNISVQSNDEMFGMVIGSGTYREGTIIQIKAIPNTGCKFVGWSDGNADAIRQILVTCDIELVAYFESKDEFGVLTYIPHQVYFDPSILQSNN